MFAEHLVSGLAPVTPFFREIASQAGLAFFHVTGASGKFYIPEIMGPGVALFDYDGDGYLDVYLVQSGMLETGKSPRDSSFPHEKNLLTRHITVVIITIVI